MQYRELGRTGLKVSAISFGCMMFGWRVAPSDACWLVASAIDQGINLFDTSVSYGRGESERILGQALQASGRRQDIVVATKCGSASEDDPTPGMVGNSRYNVIRQCELSLKRMNVERIDLLQIHRPSLSVAIEETLEALDRLVRDGKVRYVGTSNFASWQIIESLWRCDVLKLLQPSTEQLRYNLLDRAAETERLAAAQAYKLGVLVYSPLAEGLLTGTYRLGLDFPPDSRFAQSRDTARFRRMLTPAVDSALEQICAEADVLDLPVATLAISWILRSAAVTSVLAAPSNQAQLASVLRAADVVLERRTLEVLDLVNPPGCTLTSA